MSEPDPAQLIFEQLIDTPAPERQAVAEQLCKDRPALLEEVQGLLKAYGSSGNFLDLPFGDERFAAEKYPQPGDQIGRYKLLEMIGEGGFGQVFVAELDKSKNVRSGNGGSASGYSTTLQSDAQVAIKLIKPGMATQEVLKRFVIERHALSVMDHPNIARVVDAGVTDQQTPYFVMELFRGAPLTKFCDEQRLTIPERIQLFISVCAAIHHAHQKGIIHRDIKPSNILARKVADRIEFKVIDFGVAKAIDSQLNSGSILTRATQLVGTPLYMSPEQVDGSLDIDVRADVYSLGTVLYELLTGSTPLGPDSARQGYQEVSRAIREYPTPAPSRRLSDSTNDRESDVCGDRNQTPAQLLRSVRGDLDLIVLKALAKDRSQRYQSPDEFARDLQRLANNEAIEARPPSRVYRFRKFVAKNRKASAVAAACTLLLLTATFVSIRHMRIARDATVVAVKEKQRAESLASIFIGDFGSTTQFETPNSFAANVERRIDEFLNTASEKNTNPYLKLDLLNALSQIYFDAEDYTEAVRVKKRSMQYALSDAFPDESPQTVDANVEYGTFLCWAREFEEAESVLRKELAALDDRPDDFPIKSQCLIELGIAAYNLDSEDASELLIRASETIRPESIRQFRQMRRLIAVLFESNEAQLAVSVASTIFEGSQASDSFELKSKANGMLAWAHFKSGEPNRAVTLLETADDLQIMDEQHPSHVASQNRFRKGVPDDLIRQLDEENFDGALVQIRSVLKNEFGNRLSQQAFQSVNAFVAATEALSAMERARYCEVLGNELIERGHFNNGISTYMGPITQLRRENVEPKKVTHLQNLIRTALAKWSKVEPEKAKSIGSAFGTILGHAPGEPPLANAETLPQKTDAEADQNVKQNVD